MLEAGLGRACQSTLMSGHQSCQDILDPISTNTNPVLRAAAKVFIILIMIVNPIEAEISIMQGRK